ncbi:hypothetical protein [Bacillus sp. JJ722]|uniref:hypothetical protein n=1 Tax=Bacillus sp. JJ722 TaxID=3122973 RepID=UPI0030006F22
MDNYIKEKIPYLKDAHSIIEVNKGFSHDEKYVIDNKYLLRIFLLKNLVKEKKNSIL